MQHTEENNLENNENNNESSKELEEMSLLEEVTETHETNTLFEVSKHEGKSFVDRYSTVHSPQPIGYKKKNDYCQAQFQLASSVLAQLRTEISLIIPVRPHPTRESTFRS